MKELWKLMLGLVHKAHSHPVESNKKYCPKLDDHPKFSGTSEEE
jgi:hypothetical protein